MTLPKKKDEMEVILQRFLQTIPSPKIPYDSCGLFHIIFIHQLGKGKRRKTARHFNLLGSNRCSYNWVEFSAKS